MVAVIPSLISVVPEDTYIIPVGTKSANGRIRKYPGLPKDVKPKTPDVIASEISDNDWQELIWSEGTKGKLSARFSRRRVRVVVRKKKPTNETGWLLFERTKDGERTE